MNSVNIIGRLTKDPELRTTNDGFNIARFTVAVDRSLSKEKRAEAERNGQPTADFIPVTVFGQQAVNCNQYLAKGRLVAVVGRIQTGSYEKDGIRRYTTDVVASNVQFLEWGDKKEEKSHSDFGSSRASEDFGSLGFQESDDDIPF